MMTTSSERDVSMAWHGWVVTPGRDWETRHTSIHSSADPSVHFVFSLCRTLLILGEGSIASCMTACVVIMIRDVHVYCLLVLGTDFVSAQTGLMSSERKTRYEFTCNLLSHSDMYYTSFVHALGRTMWA
eukprot:scpid109985/ scgid28382/ 